MFRRGRLANRPYNGLILHAFLFLLRYSCSDKKRDIQSRAYAIRPYNGLMFRQIVTNGITRLLTELAIFFAFSFERTRFADLCFERRALFGFIDSFRDTHRHQGDIIIPMLIGIFNKREYKPS